jgi:V8-like Glu-specific endopeptidase
MKFQHHEPETVGIGTGWLIDHDTVVTAAHNLYSPTEKSHAIDIRIHIGYTQEKTTAHVRSEERRAQAVAVHWGYYATGQPQYDFAIVRLKSPFQKVRAIPFKKTPSVIPSATKLRVLGYPGDLPMDDQQLKGHIMYSSQCRVKAHDLEENGYLIEYLLDTAGGNLKNMASRNLYRKLTKLGNSGGPVLEVSDDDKFCAIGVHCYGGAINSATTIGHQGNDINGFRKALFETTGGPGVQIKEIQGKVDGLKQITVTKQQ